MMLTISGKKERLSRLSSVMSNGLIRFSLSCNGSVIIDHVMSIHSGPNPV